MTLHTIQNPKHPIAIPDTPETQALLHPWPKITLKSIVVSIILIAIYAWAIYGSESNPLEIIRGFPYFISLIASFFPPQFQWDVVYSVFETIQMALVGTTLGIVMALPFGLFAARNTAPHPWLYNVTRMLLNANRAIPDLIFAMLFVAAVGMGPFGGVLALAIGSIGSIGKVFAEAIESIDPQQVSAIRATGAGRLNTFLYGVLPQAMPVMASYSLLYIEHNFRSATILGMVGAGGIGFYLEIFFRTVQYKKLLGAILLILITVTLIDRFSDYLRKKII